MSVKFTLDPGHTANYNTGIVKGYYEGNMVFKLAGYLKAALEQYEGFSVSLTKETLASNPDLEVRGRYAINNNSQVFLSLHSNAVTDPKASGVVLIRSLQRPNSEDLGKKLGQAVATCMGTNFRGVSTKVYPDTKNTDYYGVIRASVRDANKVPYSFILEHGFHTNLKECTWLSSDDNLKKLADTEAACFATYFGAKKTNSKVVSDTTLPFKIKVGKTYQFKLTADYKPNFVAGSGGIFAVEFVKQEGRDYYFKITALGKHGDVSGFYANGQLVDVVTID